MKEINVIRKLSNALPRHNFVAIYKGFVRSHLDYGDIVNDQPNNDNFCQRIESVQYKAAPAITGAIKGMPQTKLYQELKWISYVQTLV